MTQSTFNIAVLGAARIAAGAIIPAARNVAGVQIIGVAARDPQRARAYAAQHGLPKAFDSYDALLEDADVHAVYNPLPTNEHAPWALKALEAGKHVLVEKSFAMNAAEAQTVADAAKRTGLTVMEGFMWRFHPQVAQAQEIITSGQLGDVRLIRASFSFTLQNPLDIRAYAHLGGGASYDIATYCVSGSRTMAGREPVFVNGFQTLMPASHPAGGGADEAFGGVLDFGDDLRAVIDSSFAQPFKQRLEIVGTKGALTFLEPWLPKRDHTNLLELNGEALTSTSANHYEPMLEHFMHAALGKVALRYPPEESVRQMRVLDALRASATQNGAPVKI